MNHSKKALSFLFFCLIAIIPMSGTIALRNTLILLFLTTSLVTLFHIFSNKKNNLQRPAPKVPIILWTWILFLAIFPFLAADTSTAWLNLKGQWGQSILMWYFAYMMVWIIHDKSIKMPTIALASMFPLIIYAGVALCFWFGFFEIPTSKFNLPSDSILSFYSRSSEFIHEKPMTFARIPFGFSGVEALHGNLGYTGCQAICFLCAIVFLKCRKSKIPSLTWPISGLLFCLACFAIIQSRGSTVFALILIVLFLFIFIYFSLAHKKHEENKILKHFQKKKRVLIISITSFIALFFVFFWAQILVKDARWQMMLDKAEVGWKIPSPIPAVCNGIPEEYIREISEKYADKGPTYTKALVESIKDGDGVRVLVMRAGLELLSVYPQGFDGSRHSYKRLIAQTCGHTPVIDIAHTHQAWVDLGLGLGWSGILLFASLLGYFLWVSSRQISMYWHSDEHVQIAAWSLALFLLTAFWIMRGFADSVYREHYLQMQALCMGYCYFKARWLVDQSLPAHANQAAKREA